MKDTIRICQLQTHVIQDDRDQTLCFAQELVKEAAEKGADLICLPEMFCCPYEAKNFPPRAEEEGGYTDQFLAKMARDNHVYLSAGSVPEKEVTEKGEVRIYNTAYVYDREGNKIAKHRKVHLFDIDVEGGQSFHESDTLTAGDDFVVFDTEFGPMGLCICFDVRFPETVRLMALKGARLILVPAAFNQTTGPLHWELVFRAQGMFSQVFLAGTSDARDPEASYQAWGHSIVVDPWGSVVSQMDDKDGSQWNTLDLGMVSAVRRQLPLMPGRRTDLYELKEI